MPPAFDVTDRTKRTQYVVREAAEFERREAETKDVRFPDHVISQWHGHSGRAALLANYRCPLGACYTEQPAPVVIGGNAGGNISANPLESGATTNEKIPAEVAPDSAKFPGILCEMPPQGLEPWTR